MLNVIPKPNKIEPLNGRFVLCKNNAFEFCSELEAAEAIIVPFWQRAVKQQPDNEKAGKIAFLFDKALGGEEYTLFVTEDGVEVYASTPVGALYAFQTLRQLLKLDTAGAEYISVGAVKISDKPCAKWRGVMIDVARHFFTIAELERYIDLMFLHKLNVLHLHLADDQGWRIEIKKYPKLAEVGGTRSGTSYGGWMSTAREDVPYSGFYTQDELKALVEYAAARGITIVPEIDFPAHFLAAIAAYPELSCSGEQIDVPWSMGGVTMGDASQNILCAGKDFSVKFLLDVFDEVADVFPSPYIHVGGDEAPKVRWKACPLCQKRIKEMGLKDEEELQGYLNNLIAERVAKKGKRIMGWNEILNNGNLRDDTVIQYWTFFKDRKVAGFVKRGGDVVVSKHQSFYFDMCYSQNPLKKTYCYSHKKLGIPDDGHILGVEGALWTEWLSTVEEKDVRLFPRLAALCEVAWTERELRKYPDFLERLNKLEKIYDALGVVYAEPQVFDPPFFARYKRRLEWHRTRQDGDLLLSKQIKAKKST